MSAGEAFAQYDDAVAIGSELCDALLDIARGPAFAGSDRGHLGVMASWAFEAGGQAVTITKRGTSHDAGKIQHSLADSGGTQIVVAGEDIPGMDQVFDTRTMPSSLKYAGSSISRPSDFSELFNGDVSVGDGSLTLSDILKSSVELDPNKFGLFLNGTFPDMTSASIRLAHFGDTTVGLGEFSATAVLRKAMLEGKRRVVSRAFTLQLLSGPDILVFETFDPTITTEGAGRVKGEPMLSIRGRRYGETAEGNRRKRLLDLRDAGLTPQTTGELEEIHGIGRSVIRYISGYANGYAARFGTSEPEAHPDELFARGYEAGRYLTVPKPRPVRFPLGLFGM